MKKTFLSLLCLAAAAMTFTACSDVDDFEPNNNNGKGIVFIAENPDVENNTRTEMIDENGKIVPYWSTLEILYLYVDNLYKTSYIFAAESNTPQKSATFSPDFHSPSIDGGSESCIGFVEQLRYGNCQFNKDNTADFQYSQTRRAFPLSNSHMENDLLVTEIIDLKKNTNGNMLKIKMKRLSGVIRVAVKDKTTDKFITDNAITEIIFTCPTAKLSGRMTYNYATGEITDTKASDNPTYDKNIDVSINMPFYADEEPVYFCTKPVDLKQGDVMTINIKTTSGYELQKDVTIGAQGVSFAPGMITTLNINIDDNTKVLAEPLTIADPTPDATIDPIVTANNIVMQQKGRLTSKMIAKALETGFKLKIKGDMNAFDLYSLEKIAANIERCNADTISLDMSEVNIIGGDGAKFVDFCNSKLKEINKNDFIPDYIFHNCNKLTSIILPNSVVEIYSDVFKSLSLRNITLGKSLRTIKKDAFTITHGDDIYVTYLAKPFETGKIDADFINRGKSKESEMHLRLNKEWANSTNGVYWKGISWDGSFEYIDDNGNPVAFDEGSANLTDIGNGGAGI